MTARLATLSGGRRWRFSYPVQIAALVVVAVVLLTATNYFGTPNQADAQYGQLLAAIAIIIAFARLLGAVAQRIGQPRVMGEILAGILLGPTLIGLAPKFVSGLCTPTQGQSTCSWPFSSGTIDGLHAAAEIGLAFYMFLVGLELDPTVIRQRAREAAAISLTSVILPFTLGSITALYLLRFGSTYGDSNRPLAFVTFAGVAMSVTAFPVLARILVERRMVRGPIGALALACAAIDDVVAWSLLALATVFAASGPMPADTTGAATTAAAVAPSPIAIIVLALAFCVTMAFVVRPVVARVAIAYDEAGSLSGGWIVALFVGILVAAYASQQSGIAVIFGAFVFGLIMPRRSGLNDAITSRVEDFVVIVLLPLFFVYSGLRVDLSSHLTDVTFWGWTAVLTAIAIGGKWIGASVAARVVGLDRRSSLAIGSLMNTRGLTELIVLNVGLSLKVISPELFSMLVVMALVTTFLAGPALRLIDRRGTLAVQAEAEVADAGREPVQSGAILVACQDAKNLSSLVAFGRALANDRETGREIILVRLLEPSPTGARWSRDRQALAVARGELQQQVDALSSSNFRSRAVSLISAHLGDDLSRLARDEKVDVVLTDGRRSLTTDDLPGGAVGALLRDAECDVGVLVDRGQSVGIDATHPVVVPFGGSDHDWAAVEIGARLADANGARLRLVGVAEAAGRDVGEELAFASTAVQSVSGVVAESVVVDSGGSRMLAAAADAGLLVIGLSRRWREEGLGSVRRQIASEATVPMLFVRRGVRSGLIAPSGSISEFGWSSVNLRTVAKTNNPA